MWKYLLILVCLLLFAFILLVARVLRRTSLKSRPTINLRQSPHAVVHEEMALAVQEAKPYKVYRSGRTVDELRKHLQEELDEQLAVLPKHLEVVPESIVYYIPEKMYKDSYDGSISIRLRVKPVA